MARGAKHYPVPAHLSALGISQNDFGGWLDRVTMAHVIRDRKRTDETIRPELYRKAIFRAVCDGGNVDYYTGERLDWKLLRYFSKSDGLGRDERLIPSVDHEGLNTTAPVFRICSLRTNKCKSDYSSDQLLEFCHAFIAYQTRPAASNQKRG